MKSFCGTLILLAFMLTACQSVQTLPDATVTLSPAPTETATLEPLPPTPTRIVPTPVPTLNPFEIASSVLTGMYITVSRDAKGHCMWERLLASSLTDEAMQTYQGQFFTYVTVSCYPEEWVLVEEWSEQGLGYAVPEILGWSADGYNLYFYDEIIPDGCQPLGGFEQNLRQVSLTTGAIDPYPLTWTGGMALSNDTTKVVYYDQAAQEVGVYDLVTLEETRIGFGLPEETEYWSAGNFVWSPDDQSVVFIIRSGDPCFISADSIRRVDLADSRIRTLIEADEQVFYLNDWTDPNRVQVTLDGELWWLNPVSGELTRR